MSLFKKGEFYLVKWLFNFCEVMEFIFILEYVILVKDFDFDYVFIERVLGMFQYIVIDIFGFKIIMKDRLIIRRGILLVVSLVYDLFGFVVFFIFIVKLIF